MLIFIDKKIGNKVTCTINNKKMKWGKKLSYKLTGIRLKDMEDGICTLNKKPLPTKITLMKKKYNFWRTKKVIYIYEEYFTLKELYLEQTQKEFEEAFLQRIKIVNEKREFAEKKFL